MEEATTSISLLELISKHQNLVVAVSAALSAIAAVASVFAAGMISWKQMQHSRLAARPIGQFSIGDYEDRLHVTLSNKGLGPLFVEKIVFETDGKRHTNLPLVELMPDLPSNMSWTDFSTLRGGSVVSSQSEKVLLDLRIDEQDMIEVEAANKVRRSLGCIKAVCSYKDAYDKTLPEIEQNLEWFHRRFETSPRNSSVT